MSKHNILLLWLCLLWSLWSRAQKDDSLNINLLEPSLNDILGLKPNASTETKVTIANLTETNVYEAPNIVSIITEEDMRALGARDLIDVLNTIPGISIANDVQNGTSIGIRGMWADEGKVLFMINGLVLNDMAYGSIILGQRFPLDNIKRIEVIRGSGSSIYGGLAAFGVINIITKTGQETNGHNLNVAGGLSNGRASRGVLNYNYGGVLLNKIELTCTGLISAGNRSNERYRLPDSSLVNFRDSSRVNNIHIAFSLKYDKFLYKQIYEDYNFQATYEPIYSLCRTSISDISYNFKFRKINVTPFINYKWQLPWNTQYGNPLIYDLQNLITRRITYGFSGGYKPSNWLSFLAGSQFYTDNYKHHRTTLPLRNGNYMQNYNGFIAYAEALVATHYVNINLGGRFDQYAYFKPVILPRLSITKGFKHWHYKLLYGESFKIPSLQNINLDINGNLVPEHVKDVQVELGIHNRVGEVNVTVFDNNINHMIVFGYDNNFNESYINSGHVNVRGLEVEGKIRIKKLTIKGSYSFYDVVSSTSNEILVDTANLKKGTLAFPKHRIVSNFIYSFNQANSVCLSYIYQSQKYGFDRINSVSGEYGLIRYPDTHNVNITYQRSGLLNKLLDVNVGIYNVFNTTNVYVYSFRQGYSPLIGMGRELFVKFKFNL